MLVLSLVVPAYNESKTLLTILEKLKQTDFSSSREQTVAKEIIIVNDGSKDDTLVLAQKFAQENENTENLSVKVLDNPQNVGKTQSVRNGILASTGDWVVIQDADLEYEPADLVYMLQEGLRKNCDVVYGNRFGQYNHVIYWKNFLGNLFLSILSNLFTIKRIGVFIPDMEVCYKMMRGSVARNVGQNIRAKSNFGFEPEITARLSRHQISGQCLKFLILPISYYPRSIQEGKKMKAFEDGFKALWEIIHFNLLD